MRRRSAVASVVLALCAVMVGVAVASAVPPQATFSGNVWYASEQ